MVDTEPLPPYPEGYGNQPAQHGAPHYYPPPPPSHMRQRDPLEPYVSFFLIGVIIFFIGGILRWAANFFDYSHITDVRDGSGIIMNVGILLCTLGLALGAFKATDVDKELRYTMLKAAGCCIIAGAVINTYISIRY